MQLTTGSLFSGIGGIELGLEKTGHFKTKWFIEKEEYPQRVLKKHWPETPIYEDVTKVDFNSLPKVDVLTGGFPCQDISNAGKRAGIEGSRSSLWAYYKEAISEIRPKFAVIENVSALTSRGLEKVLCDLAEIGYDAEWYCFPASSVGAHHQRDRIVVLAYPCKERCLDGQSEKLTSKRGEQAQFNIGEGGSKVSDSDDEGQSGRRKVQVRCEEFSEEKEMEDSQRNRVNERCGEEVNRGKEETEYSDKFECSGEGGSEGVWYAEPRLGRVADGIPDRVDRIKCLGNAVVPQWAEAIGRSIMMRVLP